MFRHLISRSAPYGWAALAVAGALGVRTTLHPHLGDNRPFLTFLAAVALAGWQGGKGPAIFAIVLSYVAANWFLMPPLGSIAFDYTSSREWVNFGTFVGLSSITVVPLLALQRAQLRAETSTAQIARLLAEAKQAERQKDRFLATLSHELRNPLAALSNALMLWPLRAHEPETMEEIRVVMNSEVRLMSRLVDDLLDVARIARGVIRLQKDRVDLGALIARAIESIRPAALGRGHQVHVDLAAKPLFVEADMVRLTQIFSNLLDNAIKYTGRNGEIWITTRCQDNNAVVRIRDNGPGISGAMLATVFEMFSQSSAMLDQSAGGLGIGLYLVRQLATLHGGQVEAHSPGTGKGAEFIVSLPVCEAPTAAPPAARSIRHAPVIPHHKIVVADDAQESASMLAEMLRGLGQEVAVANDGPAAVRSVMSEAPQIVFLDIAMPGMDGYEVASRLRARPDSKSLVLVAITGHCQPEDRQRALEAGFNHHLTKPANLEALEELLITI